MVWFGLNWGGHRAHCSADKDGNFGDLHNEGLDGNLSKEIEVVEIMNSVAEEEVPSMRSMIWRMEGWEVLLYRKGPGLCVKLC